MSGKQETIADIVAEMRKHQEYMRCAQMPYTEHLLRTFADRIEAAAKRAYEQIALEVCAIDDAAMAELPVCAMP